MTIKGFKLVGSNGNIKQFLTDLRAVEGEAKMAKVHQKFQDNTVLCDMVFHLYGVKIEAEATSNEQ